MPPAPLRRNMPQRWLCNTALGALLLACASASMAQQAALAGILGTKALLVIDGGTPRSVAAGEAVGGVKVVSVGSEHVVLEIGGKRHQLQMGDTPLNIGAAGGGASQRLVLRADRNGHFVNSGFINGKMMRYMIDTGASVVTVGRGDAERMGLDFEKGSPVLVSTVNGNARGWRISLANLRVGDIEMRNIDAVVVPESMPYVLLGNSFLNGFQMNRVNDEMVLEKRR